MNKLFFDIETIPADESLHGKLRFLHGKRVAKKKASEDSFDDFVDSTGLDGAYGRVLVISYAVNDAPVEHICNPNDEKKTLQEFWKLASNVHLFVGHNIMDFDLRFIYQRSMILGVRPTQDLSFARYRSSPIYDTQKEWSKWGMDRVLKNLEHLAVAMGIPTPKSGIDGSEVAKFFREGKVKEICEYCDRDVETVREIYKRMTFETVPKAEESAPF